jgi:hypothetical protein
MRSFHGMVSRSKSPAVAGRGRPSAKLLRSLRAGKASLRGRRSSLPLPEKVRQVLELQRIQNPLLARQRALRSWERPWDVEP